MDALNQHTRTTQSGFSLMETLLALAIMSVASLALFQSTTTLLRLSDRTVNAALKSQDDAIIQVSFGRLIRGLVQAWPDDKNHIFTGEQRGFSGLTQTPLQTMSPGLQGFALAVESSSEETQLIYRSESVEWVMQHFPYADARFSYLGADNIWRPQWPPEQAPKVDTFGSEELMDLPSFPLAIRLTVGQGREEDQIIWIARVESQKELPNLEDF